MQVCSKSLNTWEAYPLYPSSLREIFLAKHKYQQASNRTVFDCKPLPILTFSLRKLSLPKDGFWYDDLMTRNKNHNALVLWKMILICHASSYWVSLAWPLLRKKSIKFLKTILILDLWGLINLNLTVLKNCWKLKAV